MRLAPIKPTSLAETSWRDQLRDAYNSPQALLSDLALDVGDAATTWGPLTMRVPKALASRIEKGNPADPILQQVLPSEQELQVAKGFSTDPVGDLGSKHAKGLLHKYQGRALLITTGACAVHCRYCFRQNFPYAQDHLGALHNAQALDYLARTPSVHEVILSGGDPLMLSTKRLQSITDALASMPHIERLRIHTRLPVVLPDRVNTNLINWLTSLPWPVVMVIHANHANEFDASVDHALQSLRSVGVHLLNQAVILKGINDDSNALVALMKRGFQAGVLPYYLHQLDRVSGAHRYEVAEHRLLELMEALRQQLSGYLVPRLVREVAGAPYKLPII